MPDSDHRKSKDRSRGRGRKKSPRAGRQMSRAGDGKSATADVWQQTTPDAGRPSSRAASRQSTRDDDKVGTKDDWQQTSPDAGRPSSRYTGQPKSGDVGGKTTLRDATRDKSPASGRDRSTDGSKVKSQGITHPTNGDGHQTKSAIKPGDSNDTRLAT